MLLAGDLENIIWVWLEDYLFSFWFYLSLCRKSYRSTSDSIDISMGAGCTELPMGAGDLVSPSGLEHCMIRNYTDLRRGAGV